MAIVQWNIRGYRGNYHELRTLIADTNPHCVCLQETKLNVNDIYSPRGYDILNVNRVDGEPHGGVAILVRSELPYTKLNLTTDIQAVAVRVQLDRLYTE